MNLEQLMAFTLTDDHARQQEVWAGLGWDRDAETIRGVLTEDHVCTNRAGRTDTAGYGRIAASASGPVSRTGDVGWKWLNETVNIQSVIITSRNSTCASSRLTMTGQKLNAFRAMTPTSALE
ncbi:hypothetical protein IVB33_33325 [Bradyrhizobium sp. 24]|uniref:hypothetical protein n=1 Tax=unclassified Bradyrhizobium TaxID=2631580 RepID=UPI001FFA2CBB|nr:MULTISPECIES: hypothetical protein [unclassified Bradyrhizobium]MCK1381599.1 hypothetical protein [Bradyrhizobium sp. 24]